MKYKEAIEALEDKILDCKERIHYDDKELKLNVIHSERHEELLDSIKENEDYIEELNKAIAHLKS